MSLKRSEFCALSIRRLFVCNLVTLIIYFGHLQAAWCNEASGIHSLAEATRFNKYSDITFFVRLPKEGMNSDSQIGTRLKGKAVRGVLALCTHRTEPKDVKVNVTDDGRFKWFVKFADQHNLALVTWTNFKGYRTDVSGDEMDEDRYEQYDKDFDERAREWRKGFRRLCRKYDLPEDNVLMYGISGGAQMAHRLALRMPEFFFGVHVHVNSSYDQIKRDGSQILWLVTTCTQEYGYPAGVRFYRDAIDAGYHMIFRAEENLGHSDSSGTRATAMAFWDYCIKFLPDATNPDWRPPPVDRFYLMRYPTYVGDYLNAEAFKREVAPKYIAPEVMVALPTEEIAEAWGTVLNIE